MSKCICGSSHTTPLSVDPHYRASLFETGEIHSIAGNYNTCTNCGAITSLAGSDDSVLNNKVALEQALVDLQKERLALAKETARYQALSDKEDPGAHAQAVLDAEATKTKVKVSN